MAENKLYESIYDPYTSWDIYDSNQSTMARNKKLDKSWI